MKKITGKEVKQPLYYDPSITLDPIRLELYFAVRYKGELTPFENFLGTYDLKPRVERTWSGDNYDRYEFIFDTPNDVLLAGAVLLEHSKFDEDDCFYNMSCKLLNINWRSDISELSSALFKQALLLKYERLLSIRSTLFDIFNKLVDTKDMLEKPQALMVFSSEDLVKNIGSVIAKNKSFFNKVIEVARIKTSEHNNLMFLHNFCLKIKHEQLLAFVEAESVFKYLDKEKLLDQQFITTNDVNTLIDKVSLILMRVEKLKEMRVKEIENHAYPEVMKNYFRYFSLESPLISLIHEKTMDPEEKKQLLCWLADGAKYTNTGFEYKHLRDIKGGVPEFSDPETLGSIWLRTPLQHAVEYGSLTDVQILLLAGANIATRGDRCFHDSTSALHIAVDIDDVEKAELLIKNGADIHGRDKALKTPLFLAKSPAIAELFMTYGADVNALDSDGNSPLYYAAENNHVEVVLCLLRNRDTRVSLINKKGNTALHVASNFALEVCETYSNCGVTYPRVKPELGSANMTIIEALLAHGADINQKNKKGHTPLYLAVRMLTKEADFRFMQDKIKYLCSKGANPNLAREQTDTILRALYSSKYNLFVRSTFVRSPSDVRRSVYMERKAIAEILIRSGARVMLDGESYNPLLHLCAQVGDSDGLKYFLELGFNPNMRENDASPTPLEMVIACSYFYSSSIFRKMVDLLVQFGANSSIKSKHDFIVSKESLNPFYRGIYLTDLAISQIISQDNFVSQEAKRMGIDSFSPIQIQRGAVEQIFKEAKESKIAVTVELYPEDAAFFTGIYNRYAGINSDNVQYIRDIRAKAQRSDNHGSGIGNRKSNLGNLNSHTFYKRTVRPSAKVSFPQEIREFVRKEKETGPEVALALYKMQELGESGDARYSPETVCDIAKRYLHYCKLTHSRKNLNDIKEFIHKLEWDINEEKESHMTANLRAAN